ncbi:MAG: glycosyltransferase family 2 protein [Chitinophagales bacterium]|nr:glycosyltransferase family 2 protein [Chitinophagales bacterium]
MLSIIIVNYNVRFFLEQALLSVRKAIKNIDAEIFVVDNNSVDGSIEMLHQKFTDVILIENKNNVGFATANNQAIVKAKGEFILLLNPDTIVEEDTFEKCLRFMEQHPKAGALGVKMLDGKGNFLPESKRGFPTPFVAFCKAFGLSKIFPHSKTFNRYHLGFLSENETHEIDVLAGAYMFLRKSALEKSGLLDEQFFMYGEDIDLSYRIVKAGYKNYYFPETRIIHYKGESTKRGTMNYVRMFYQAMIIFAQKHFSTGSRSFYVLMLKFAIYLRAMLSVISRVVKRWSLALLDAIAIYIGMLLIKDYWEYHIKVSEGLKYPTEYILIVIPSYLFIWLLSVFLSGGYEKNAKPSRIVRGLFIGTIIIAAIYAFLPESLRFSRAMILLGAAWAVFITIVVRMILHFIQYKNFRIGETQEKKLIIVGSATEANRVNALLNQAKVKNDLIGFVSVNGEHHQAAMQLGELHQLKEIVAIYKIDEIIFCAKDISSQKIIERMTAVGSEPEYKIVPEDSLSIIGSSSKDSQGELYTIDIKLSIASSFNKRNKRLFDVVACLFLIITIPINVFMIRHPLNFIQNIFLVMAARKTWVGYGGNEMQQQQLPSIKKGILTPLDELGNAVLNDASIARINLLYAKDYSAARDAELFAKCYRKLGS